MAAPPSSGGYATGGEKASLYYEIFHSEKATGCPIVLLHGGGGTARSFETSLIPALKTVHPILALDFRGDQPHLKPTPNPNPNPNPTSIPTLT